MKKKILIEIPGFSKRLLPWATSLQDWASKHKQFDFEPSIPALTLPAHASLVTGCDADTHGIYGNGSYCRKSNKVEMWPQSEGLIEGEKIWEHAKKKNTDFTCFKYFWWPGMNSTADVHANVRPVYHVDGRKSPGMYCNRPALSETLQQKFGTFPLFHFWGPATSIKSTQWILDTASYCIKQHNFDLSLLYLPHLDYKQQSLGPYHPDIQHEVEDLDRALMPFIEKHQDEYDIIILSSYHINEVDTPIDINRILRKKGLLQTVKNSAGETIDFAQSQAFSVSDHQIAQLYVEDTHKDAVRELLESIDEVDTITEPTRQNSTTPDFICYAKQNAWFTYYYWLDEKEAPDFAHTVAIHAKPGYDPCELLLDPTIRFPRLRIAQTLLKKMLGFRSTMNLIPTNGQLIKGSHGLAPQHEEDTPICLSSCALSEKTTIKATDIKKLLTERL